MRHSGDIEGPSKECITFFVEEKKYSKNAARTICETYGDYSCSMGSDPARKRGGDFLVCYNALKSWQTGWYNNYCVDLTYPPKYFDEYWSPGIIWPLDSRTILRASAPKFSDRDYYIKRSDTESYCKGVTVSETETIQSTLNVESLTQCLTDDDDEEPMSLIGGYSIKVLKDEDRESFDDPPTVCIYRTDWEDKYKRDGEGIDPCDCEFDRCCPENQRLNSENGECETFDPCPHAVTGYSYSGPSGSRPAMTTYWHQMKWMRDRGMPNDTM